VGDDLDGDGGDDTSGDTDGGEQRARHRVDGTGRTPKIWS
jgi:hypothetical protein